MLPDAARLNEEEAEFRGRGGGCYPARVEFCGVIVDDLRDGVSQEPVLLNKIVNHGLCS